MQYDRLVDKAVDRRDSIEFDENQSTTKKKPSSQQRLEDLEKEVSRLKDQQTKSRIHTKELEQRLKALEEMFKGLTEPKEPLAAPFSFGTTQRLKHQFKKSNSVEIVTPGQDINFDHVLSPQQQQKASRERVGLFGSLGAASQHR